MDVPKRRTKHAELFEKAVEVGSGKCVAKTFDTKDGARALYNTLRFSLRRYKEREPRWEGLEVFRRGTTVYVHLKGES